jgi:hypothetical protein
MRKFAVLGTLAAVCAAGALALAGRVSRAQQPGPARADSLVAPELAAADTGALRGPRQPIFFRHDIHAGQFKIACQYCHYSVESASEPGIPTLQTCMGCHLAVSGSDSGGRAEIRKLRTFWNDRDKPDAPRLEWVRVHTLARHAHVARMPQVWEVNNVNNMGFCINCHRERKVSQDCSVCHY